MMDGRLPAGGTAGGVDLAALVRDRAAYGPLQREFYTDPGIFALDMARIFARQWLYVAHSCEIPRAGDWLTYAIGTDGIIVLRGEDGGVSAFHNTCRHRGSRLCIAAAGHSKRL